LMLRSSERPSEPPLLADLSPSEWRYWTVGLFFGFLALTVLGALEFRAWLRSMRRQ
jgi:hypothetical protein